MRGDMRFGIRVKSPKKLFVVFERPVAIAPESDSFFRFTADDILDKFLMLTAIDKLPLLDVGSSGEIVEALLEGHHDSLKIGVFVQVQENVVEIDVQVVLGVETLPLDGGDHFAVQIFQALDLFRTDSINILRNRTWFTTGGIVFTGSSNS